MKGWTWKRVFTAVAIAGILVSCLRAAPFLAQRETLSYDGADFSTHWEGRSSHAVEEVPLQKGIYSVHVSYLAQQDLEILVRESARLGGGTAGTAVPLPSYGSAQTFRVCIDRQTNDPYRIVLKETADSPAFTPVSGSLSVVYHPGMSAAYVFLCTFVPFGILLAVMALMGAARKREDEAFHGTLYLLAVFFLFISLPPLLGRIVNERDILFHMSRIAHLSDALFKSGYGFRIQSGWHNGYGYPVGIFYGELLMIPASVLFRAGVPLWICYNMYLLELNALMTGISYFSFAKISGSRTAGLAATVLYCGSVWHLSRMYLWNVAGECAAMCFLPLLACGFYGLFSEETNREEHARGAVRYLTVAFTGLIQTHVITAFQAGLFCLVFCLCKVRALRRENRFLTLLRAAGMTLLLNAWFIIPFLDYYLRYDLQAERVTGIAWAALRPADFFFTDEAMGGIMLPYTMPGWGIWCALFAGGMLLVRCARESRTQYRNGLLLGALCLLALYLSSSLMPWEALRERVPGLYNLAGGRMQFASRYLVIAVWLIPVLFAYLCRGRKNDAAPYAPVRYACLGLVFVTLLQGARVIRFTVLSSVASGTLKARDVAAIDFNGHGDNLYVFDDVDLSRMPGESPQDTFVAVSGDNVAVSDVTRSGSRFTLSATNRPGAEGFLDFPLWNYHGYVARDGSGARLPVSDGEGHRVRVTVPDGFAGTVRLFFSEPWYWRLAELVSLLSAVYAVSGKKHRDAVLRFFRRNGGMTEDAV